MNGLLGDAFCAHEPSSAIAFAIVASEWISLDSTVWKIAGVCGAACFVVAFAFGQQVLEWLKEIIIQLVGGPPST